MKIFIHYNMLCRKHLFKLHFDRRSEMGTTKDQQSLPQNYITIRRMVRSMTNHHWSIRETLDEYDIPEEDRQMYIETIGSEFLAD